MQLHPGSISIKTLCEFCYKSLPTIVTNIKLIFSGNSRVFIVCEANYSYQFCYLIKKCADDIQSQERELIARRRMEKELTIYITYFYKYCALLDISR